MLKTNTDKDGNVIGEGKVDEDGNIKIETNRPLETGEVITVTPSTNGKKGIPITVTVLPRNESGNVDTDNNNVQDPQKPMVNQPGVGNHTLSGVSGQNHSSKDLPKMGEEIYKTTSILGVLMALFSR